MASSFVVRQEVLEHNKVFLVAEEQKTHRAEKDTVKFDAANQKEWDHFLNATETAKRGIMNKALAIALQNYRGCGFQAALPATMTAVTFCANATLDSNGLKKCLSVMGTGYHMNDDSNGVRIVYEHDGKEKSNSCDNIQVDLFDGSILFTLGLHAKGNVDAFAHALQALLKQVPAPSVPAVAAATSTVQFDKKRNLVFVGIDAQKGNWISDLLKKTKLTSLQLAAILQSISDYSSSHTMIAEATTSLQNKHVRYYNVKTNWSDPKNKTYLRFYYRDNSPKCVAIRAHIDNGFTKPLTLDFGVNGDTTFAIINKAIANLTAKSIGTKVAVVK